MTDDIVTRLYNLCICCRCGCEQQCSDCEAADEIERLRGLVHRWETCKLVVESLCDMDNPESFCDTCKETY